MSQLTEHQHEEVQSAGELYRGIMIKAFTGEASPRGAIKAFCLHCTGYQRAEITHCTARRCPLFAYRPYQGASQPDEKGPRVPEGAE